LRLPLEHIVGNAIADYLDKARPNCDCENIFVTASASYVALSKSVLSGIVNVPRQMRESREHKGICLRRQSYKPCKVYHQAAFSLITDRPAHHLAGFIYTR
jgi:hypothetical protein